MDAEFREFLEVFPPLQFVDPAAQREAHAKMRAELPPVPLPEGVVRKDDTVRAPDGFEVPVHRYVPADIADGAPPVLWIHGGGYVIGTPDEDEPLCARLAIELRTTVVSVGYRLAPEHPFPAGLDDCYAALLDVASAGRAPVVAGASAGGGLAAAVVVRARDENGPAVRAQVLLYPFLDATMRAASLRTLAESPVFNAADARDCWGHYLGNALADPPSLASPSIVPDLSGLSPAYVLVAGEDCLRDEAIDYALKLQAAGTAVELHVVPEVPHAFTALLPGAAVSRRIRAGLFGFLKATCQTV